MKWLRCMDGDVETWAILDYLDSLVPAAERLIPAAEPERHRALRVCALSSGLADKIVGLKELGDALGKAAKELPKDGWLDLDAYPLSGVEKVDALTWRIRIKGKYPQFAYWLAMPFFAPVPREVTQQSLARARAEHILKQRVDRAAEVERPAALVERARRAHAAEARHAVLACEHGEVAAVREEIFGPVVTVMPFDDDAQAVRQLELFVGDRHRRRRGRVVGRGCAREYRQSRSQQEGQATRRTDAHEPPPSQE